MKAPQKQSKALPKSELKRLKKLTELESANRSKGYQYLAGVDEAGRGPLAGPVVAAACCILEGVYFPGINDSKLLTPKVRKSLFEQLLTHDGVSYGIGIVEPAQIDRINILRASLEAMRIAISRLPFRPDCLLVDGLHSPTDEIYTLPIVKGDSLSQMIAAASIIAKETRDQIMIEYHSQYPEYGFADHKGYATSEHCLALAKYGPCPIHRRSFATVAATDQLEFNWFASPQPAVSSDCIEAPLPTKYSTI